jgi:protoporphyrinogen oxidase
MSEAQLITLASEEIVKLNLGVNPGDVEDGCVIRQYKAYPVYDGDYKQHLQVLQDYVKTFKICRQWGAMACTAITTRTTPC